MPIRRSRASMTAHLAPLRAAAQPSVARGALAQFDGGVVPPGRHWIRGSGPDRRVAPALRPLRPVCAGVAAQSSARRLTTEGRGHAPYGAGTELARMRWAIVQCCALWGSRPYAGRVIRPRPLRYYELSRACRPTRSSPRPVARTGAGADRDRRGADGGGVPDGTIGGGELVSARSCDGRAGRR